MSCDLRLLARQAFPSPFARVFADGRPDELGTHCLSRPFNAGMSETVNHIEDSATRWERNVGPEGTVAGVDDQLGRSNVYRLEVESTSGIVSELSEFRIDDLLSGDLFPVDRHISYCRNNAVKIGGCSFLLCC